MKILKPATVIMCSLILISSCKKVGNNFDFGLKPNENAIFEAIKRDEHLLPHYTYESSIANFAGEEQSVCIRSKLKEDRHRSMLPFKWVIDIPADDYKTEKNKQGIAELDALSAANILSKNVVSSEINSQGQDAYRYRLTRSGWGETTDENRNGTCFLLGKASYLSIISVEKKEVPIGNGKNDTVYLVNSVVGFPKDFKLPDWANNLEVRKAFPVIDKLVNGYSKQVYMQKSFGQWREYLSLSDIERMEKSGQGRSERYSTEGTAATTKQFMIDSLMSPSYQKRHDGGWSCISLPGQSSNGVKVDQDMSKKNGLKYSVAVYDNKERNRSDDTESKTLPLLQRLVSAGLLTSTQNTTLSGSGRDVGKIFSGTVFSLAPNYEHIIDKERNCVYLGPGEISIVDLQIIPDKTNNTQRPMLDTVKYKYISIHNKPPEWAKDPVLQYWWPDLKGALENGFACNGSFLIDLQRENHMGSGSGSCWWAYDSEGML